MGASNAFHVKTTDQVLLQIIRNEFPDAVVTTGAEFTTFQLPATRTKAPEQALLVISEHLETEVFWLSSQSDLDSFQFHFWREGTLVRSLIFGCFGEGRAWDRAFGKVQPWEKAAFFSDKYLQIAQEYASQPAEKQELERLWQANEIRKGRSEPSINARECAQQAAAFYGLPYKDD